jgi:hypothetical protein
LLVAIGWAAIGGCGAGGPEVVDFRGRILKGGEPVPHVVLQISPLRGRPSTARTDEEGRFRPEFSQQIRNGVMPGNCRVSIQVMPESIDRPVNLNDPKYHPAMKEILQQFGDWRTSPIQIEVRPGLRELDIELDDYLPVVSQNAGEVN